ncbi:TIGR00730 family Rossman fold protein [Rhodovibrionaceae bacterium A322]
MKDLKTLCLYCGSASNVDPSYLESARELGRMTGERGVKLVYGGGRVGLMGVAADAALEAGGKVHGIIPQHLNDWEVGHTGLTELEIVETMHERKKRMFDLSDAFVALPGGLGTLDETFELVTWRQLGLHDKPMILVNVNGFWDPLLNLIRHQADSGFLRPEQLAFITPVSSPQEVFQAIAEAPTPKIDPSSKWA